MKLAESENLRRIWHISAEHPDEERIQAAAEIILGGGVIVYPTETFYGLGASTFLESAAVRIYKIKKRDLAKPLPLIASNIDQVLAVVSQWPSVAQQLAFAFWPGPLTIVLPASRRIPSIVHAHTGKIAIRVSSHPVALALCSATGGPIISTSANASGNQPFSNGDDISPSLLSSVDAFLHAGTLSGGLPSTIVDASVEPTRLVRSGCIAPEAIRKILSVPLSF